MSFKYVKSLKPSTLIRKGPPPPPPPVFSKLDIEKFVIEHVEAKTEKQKVSRSG